MSIKTSLSDAAQRIAGAWGSLTGSNKVWMGPGDPIESVVPAEQQAGVHGRQFDFPVGYNQRMQPRQGEENTFAQLRSLADNCDILRLVIETRKDQMAKMEFSIQPIDAKNKRGATLARCAEVQEFLRFPDGENRWEDWLRMLLEDMFVIDAATIYPWLTEGGAPYRFEVIDGATIKRVLDVRGRTPAAPAPAYQQVLKGVVASNYTIDELVYAPRNKRSNKVYGYSPVEQVLVTVNIAIRRSLHQLQYYTDGSTPDLLFQAPKDWNMKQIAEFNDYWESVLSGNTAMRRQARFVPNGVEPINTKEAALTDKYDEWLARIVCYAFSVSPQAFVAQVNRATAETAHKQALEEGLHPVMGWAKGVVDRLIYQYFGYKDIELRWKSQDVTSADAQSLIDDRAIRNGSLTINEARAARGLDSVAGGDEAMVLVGSGYVPINAYYTDDSTADIEPAEPTAAPQPTQKIKVRKAKKTGAGVKTIDRDRKEIKKLRAKFEKVVLACFDELKKEALSDFEQGLEKAAKKTTSVEKDLYEAALPLYEKVVKSGVRAAALQIDVPVEETFTLVNEHAADWAASQAAQLVGMKIVDGDLVPNPDAAYSLTETTREFIRGDVTVAMEEGWSTDELAKALEENYGFSATRAEVIARTETASADVQGNLIVYKESGISKKKWLASPDCCDDCQELDGEEVGIDEDFKDGTQGPPLHPQCRCDVVPIIEDEE